MRRNGRVVRGSGATVAGLAGLLALLLIPGGLGVAPHPAPPTAPWRLPHWVNETAAAGPGPGPRNGSASAYDPATDQVVVFGGLAPNGTVLGDMWVFQNGSWSRVTLAPGAAPGPRAFASMTYDATDGELLLFGGTSAWPATNAAKLNDTWGYRHGVWHQLHPKLSPKARFAASMTFDALDGYVLLFGGNTTYGPYADTWSFAHGNWTKLAPAHAPTPRSGAAMTYDRFTGLVVMTNGRGLPTAGARLDNDSWLFAGGQWHTTGTAGFDPKPIYRWGAAMGSGEVAKVNVTMLAGGSVCPTCYPSGYAKLRTAGQFVQAFVVTRTGTPSRPTGNVGWRSLYPTTPLIALNTEFPVLAYDGHLGEFLYYVDGYTWAYR